MKHILLLVVSILIFGCSAYDDRIDMIIKNARVFDGENYRDGLQTIFISGNKIHAISPSIPEQIMEGTRVIDADGKLLMPGFIEGHGHFLSFGETMAKLKLDTFDSWDNILKAVDQKAREVEPGTWIQGRGWHQEKWTSIPDNAVLGYPHHDRLSTLVPDHPVYLEHASGHAGIINGAAIRLLGLSSETADPEGGRMLRDDKGQLSGILEENAMEVVEEYIYNDQDHNKVWQSAMDAASERCLKYGITSFQDAGSKVEETHWLRKKADQNELPVRLYVMLYDSLHNLEAALPDIRTEQNENNYFSCRAVKAYFDGALGSRGAWLLEEYNDQPGYYGQNLMTEKKLTKIADLCQANNLQYCIHAIGDRANRETLNLFEKYTIGKDLRWRVEHAQHIDPDDHGRFDELRVIASMQPIHCTSDAPFVHARLGEARARSGAYVWRELINKNAFIAVGTDVPVESMNPFENIYAAVTRRATPGRAAFYPDQKMTRLEVLRAYTVGNAYAAFEENLKGEIAVGYLADLCLLDTNLFSCNEEDIPNTNVLYTILDGKVVYENN